MGVSISSCSEKNNKETENDLPNTESPNILFIIADDLSTDNSVTIIKEWLINNEAQFIENKINYIYKY